MSHQLILKAAHFAAEKHRAQKRKGADGEPYINHPLTVARVLADAGVDDADVLCAALLHDTVEDTETSLDELVVWFGAEIANLVEQCTDDKKLPKSERKRLQVEHSPHMSPGGQLVKLADKLSNVRDVIDRPPDWPTERKLAYFDWAEAVVAGLRGIHPDLEAQFDATLIRGRAALGPAL